MCGSGNAEIAEQQQTVGTQQHVFWLDITVNQALLMGISQGRGYLGRIVDNSGQRHTRTLGMAVTQGTPLSIVHHQEGFFLLTEPKIEQGHDMGMMQTKRTSFIQKRTPIIGIGQTYLEDFNSDLGVITKMLGQINVAKTAASKPLEQAIFAHGLPKTFLLICHVSSSPLLM
jgi:hypothetical protein